MKRNAYLVPAPCLIARTGIANHPHPADLRIRRHAITHKPPLEPNIISTSIDRRGAIGTPTRTKGTKAGSGFFGCRFRTPLGSDGHFGLRV